MRVEIIIIGDELLRGEVLDRNAPVISRALASLGLVPTRIGVTGDDLESLEAELRCAATRADLVVTSGGLGVSHDDTAPAAARAVAGAEPGDVEVIPPPVGTTPGASFEVGSARVFMLPGDPVAMAAMLEAHVLPAISRPRGRALFTARLRTFGVSVAEVSREVAAFADPEAGVEVGLGQAGLEVEVIVRAQAHTREEAARRARAVAAKVCTRLGHDVHGPAGETLAEAVATAMRARGWSLAAVEIGSGGLLGQQLTEVAAGSGYFLADLATESDRMCDLILGAGVSPAAIVSADATLALAEQMRTRTGADVGLALCIVAGPSGGSPEAPVGLVHCAIAGPGGQRTEHRRFMGMDRGHSRQWAAVTAMRQALDYCREARG